MMTEKLDAIRTSDLECCPELERMPVCDTLIFRYRFPFRQRVESLKLPVPIDVILHFQLERCSGPLVLGDPIYSTTLLPEEQVRLFTSDRHTRWSYDSESNMSYRHETTSEESFFTASVAQAMSDLTINESSVSSSSFEESSASGGGGASFSFFGLFEIGGGGGGGSYDSQSLRTFSYSLRRHAECASRAAAAGVRAKSATSIGEVERRTHAESESESSYESASRTFRNDNRCHAVTYLFYKINKMQTIRFKLVAIERRIVDFTTQTDANLRVPIDTTGGITVLPQVIPATSKNRLALEQVARESADKRYKAVLSAKGLSPTAQLYSSFTRTEASAASDRGDPAYTVNQREKALEALDADLERAGVIVRKDKQIMPAPKFVEIISWERKEMLPTPGILVKGCLDKCDTCEPGRKKEIELDLERKQLENEMLKKQVELLEKSQEYRCCPGTSGEDEEPCDG